MWQNCQDCIFEIFHWCYWLITSTLNPYHTNRILERDYPNLYVHILILRKIELFKDNVREKFLAWNVYLPLVYLRTSLRNVNPHKRSIYEFNWMVFSLNSSDVNPINPSWNTHWITRPIVLYRSKGLLILLRVWQSARNLACTY